MKCTIEDLRRIYPNSAFLEYCYAVGQINNYEDYIMEKYIKFLSQDRLKKLEEL